ncbi:hypothetical protein ACIRYZ_44540 [Kitasatospora sp. NPDC101155]|uniref:hypothetical protein n=1 Tax=Kitasatospora sp. NPDC101155 TaxID=3364097 RepID=UPI003830BB5F
MQAVSLDAEATVEVLLVLTAEPTGEAVRRRVVGRWPDEAGAGQCSPDRRHRIAADHRVALVSRVLRPDRGLAWLAQAALDSSVDRAQLPGDVVRLLAEELRAGREAVAAANNGHFPA